MLNTVIPPDQPNTMNLNRRRKSQKRYDLLEKAKGYVGMMKEEEGFEERFGKREGGWGEEWKEWMKDARGKEKNEQERNNMPISPKLQARAHRLWRKEESKKQS